MKYYILDTTKNPRVPIMCDTYPEVIKQLEGLTIKRFNQTRKQRMVLLEEVGHGEDDIQGVNFVRAMSESFEIGVVRDGKLMRCDITAVALYQKEEYGS